MSIDARIGGLLVAFILTTGCGDGDADGSSRGTDDGTRAAAGSPAAAANGGSREVDPEDGVGGDPGSGTGGVGPAGGTGGISASGGAGGGGASGGTGGVAASGGTGGDEASGGTGGDEAPGGTGGEVTSGGTAGEPGSGGNAGLGAAGSAGGPGAGGLTSVTPADLGYVPGPAITKSPLITGSTSEVTYSAQVPAYGLPLDPSEVVNLETDVAASSLISWTAEAEAALAQRGIVALPGLNRLTRFDSAYTVLENTDAPILVTTDSTLHLYHIFFDQVLKSLEMQEMLPLYEALLPAVVEKLRGLQAALDGDSAEAARRCTAALSVAAKLMFPDTFAVPPEVAEEVDAVIALVEQASGFALEPIFNHECSEEVACSGGDVSDEEYLAGAACFCEDYSQYKPRGHYTEHPALERYFRGAMYLGRIGLRIKSPMETRMAALLTSAMASTSVTFRDADVPAIELWDRLRRITSFFVGAPDDLTFLEYDTVLQEVYGDDFELSALEDDAQLAALRARLREERAPQILSGMMQWYLDLTEQTQGLRFLGQSFTFDSYTLSRLVFANVGPQVTHADYQYVVDYPDSSVVGYCDKATNVTGNYTSCEEMNQADWAWLCCKAGAIASIEDRPELLDVCRLLPKGLDVAAAFGSSRAAQHLEPDSGYCDYDTQLASLQEEASAFTDEDHWKTLYTGWLHSISPLFERDTTGMPTWMDGDTYRDKALQTGLASWAELRHDTILYVKQSYTSGVGGASATPPPEVNPYYVEPQPEVYSRLADLTRLTRDGLTELEMLSADVQTPMTSLETLLERLKTISVAELQHEVISATDQEYISRIGQTFTNIVRSIGDATSVAPEPTDDPNAYVVSRIEGDPFKTTIVADVHTDGNTRRVLEAGSGYVDWVVVVNLDPSGALVASIGPIFSYYEFPQPMSDRLNDDEWATLLGGADAPARPSFVAGLYVQ